LNNQGTKTQRISNHGFLNASWLLRFFVVKQALRGKIVLWLAAKTFHTNLHKFRRAELREAQTDTWNYRHLANAAILSRLQPVAERYGHRMPHVCTPLQLMGTIEYED
jgi:hypothetical protein